MSPFKKFLAPVSASLCLLPVLAGCSGSTSGTSAALPGLSQDTVIFVSTRRGNQDLFAARSNGTEARQLTATPGAESDPCRSRDGKQVVFSSNRAGNSEIYTLEFGPGGVPGTVSRLTADSGAVLPEDTKPIFSPDGTKILWTSTRGGSRGFWTMDRNGDNQVRVAGTAPVGLFDPAWHPDSTRLVGFRGTGPGTFQIGIFTPGGTFTSLANTTNPGNARFSPDGTRVVWEGGATSSPLSLFSLVVATPPATVVATAPGRDFTETSFSPDSQTIVYTGEDGAGQPQLFTRRLGETTETKLTVSGDNFSPSWVD